MARYRNTRLRRKMDSGINYYETTIYEEVLERNDDMHFIAQEGDRCDNLAFRFYGDPNLWWFIARVNHLKGMNIEKGTKLRIPISTEKAKGF